ncbi:hypothetical protein ACWCPT_35335, partial [Streptomyces sp. NPDC002308]
LGETTSVGPQAHQADGYSSVTHELAHLVHDALSADDRAQIEAVWENKRARGASVPWPDGVRLDLDGRRVDNYASTSADEYFAQLSNAYLGTNHGTDAATGRPRNNGAAYVRLHERELLPLLERLYGTDPGAYGTPANPVAATAADDAVYGTFVDAMALTGQSGPSQDTDPTQVPPATGRSRAASGADAGPVLDQVRSSTVMLGQVAVGRDFLARWPAATLAGQPQQYRWLEHTIGLSGRRGYAPSGVPSPLPPALAARTTYLVQARLARDTPNRIRVIDAASGEPRQLTFAEFARVLASDPHLTRTDPAVPVVLLVPDSLSRNLELLRAVRDALGRPVWGHTGRPMLIEEEPSRLGIGVGLDEGRGAGQWIHLPADSRGPEPESPEPVRTVDGQLIDPADLALRPFADSEGRLAGHRSMEEAEFASSFEHRLPGVVQSADYDHVLEISDGEAVVTGTAPVPWVGQSPGPYFLLAHGLPGAAQLVTVGGRRVNFSGQQVGFLLRRRRSFTELFRGSSVAALVCHSALAPGGSTTTFVQALANTTGRTAYGSPSRVALMEEESWLAIHSDRRTGEAYTWKVAVSEPRDVVLDALAYDTGLRSRGHALTAQDRITMRNVLRTSLDLQGVGGRERQALRPLAALARLHQDAYVGRTNAEPFDRNVVREIAREAYDWDASATVSDDDLVHLLRLIDDHGPSTLADLLALGRANAPVFPSDNGLGLFLAPEGPADGDDRRGTGVRGAPPGSRRSSQAAVAGPSGGTRPRGQTLVSLSPAEARRLATAAVDAEAVALTADGRYERDAESEQKFIDRVAQRLLEFVPQAQAVRPFAPTAELGRLFMEIETDAVADVRPEVLPYLAEQPDLLTSVSESHDLRRAVLTQPLAFAQLLRAHPNVLRELGTGAANADLYEHAALLVQHMDVVRAMENDAELRRQVVKRITLIGDLGGKLVLIRAVADNDWLADAVIVCPQLGEALRTAPAPMAAVRTLRNNLALTSGFDNYPDAVPDADQVRSLLGNTALVQATHRYPQQVQTLFRVPELLTAARKDPGILRVLDGDPPLSDVLPESPELARRLAGAPELLRTAFSNPRLAEALSYEPNRFDSDLGDDARLGQLLGEAVPEIPRRPEVPSGALPALRLLAHPKVYAAVARDKELRQTLLGEAGLTETLLAHPDLLRAPHEYRRLLSQHYADLREQVRPGSPLLVPGLLRGLLRMPNGGGSVVDEFTTSDTVDAGQDDTRRILADALTGSPALQAAVQADTVVLGLAFNSAEQLHQMDIAGIGQALRTEGRLAALLDRNPFVVPLLVKRTRVLSDLLANDSALLQLALAAREVIATLQETPDLLPHVVERPAVLRALAGYENDVTPSAHWARLFEDRALLAALDSADGLAVVKALASSPDLLTDALARDGFVERVKEPGRLQEYVELNRRSSKTFAEAVRAAGEPSLTRSGIRIAAEPALVARAVLDSPDRVGAVVDSLAVDEATRDRYRRAAEAAVVALKERPELRRAVDREFGIVLAMLTNSEMTATLLKRPALIGYLSDRTKGALNAVHDRPELTRALRENGRLYLRFISDAYLVQSMTGPTFGPFVEALGRNREFIRAYETDKPVVLSDDPGAFLLRTSEALAAALADNKEVVAALAESPDLLDELYDLFLDDEAQPVTGPEWEAVESVARAVVSSTTVLRALGDHEELLGTLAAGLEFSRVLAENPGALTTEEDVVGLLRNEQVVAVLNAYPLQAGVVLRTAGLLPVVMETPALIEAMAGSEHLTGLLGRADVRSLLAERPEVAEDLVRMPELVDALGGLPGLVEAMRLKPAVAGLLRDNPGLLGVVRARRTLVDDLARDTALWRALSRVPALSEALSQSARMLRHLRRRPVLVEALASDSVPVTVSGAQLLAVLSDDVLTALLDSRPGLVGAVLGSPELAGRAVEDGGFADRVRILARDRAKFDEALREPGRLLAELDRMREASRTAGTAAGQAPRKGASTTPEASSRTTAAAAGARNSADAEIQAAVRRLPALKPLQRHHREVMVALTRDEEVLGLLDQGDLLRRVVESPELAALVAAYPDLAEELKSAARAEEFRFDLFLARTAPAWDLERDFAAYAERLGALDVPLHEESRRLVRGAAEPAWRAAEVAHRETAVAEQRAREERLSAFRAHLPETWEYSGEVRYGNGLHAESFTGVQLRVLTALSEGGSRPRERVFGANQAVHAHLDGGSGGVSFAYVLGGDGRVGLLAYGLSTSRQGNDYRWDGNGGTYISGPLPLEAVEDAPALLASQDLVAQADTRRAADPTRSPKLSKKAAKSGGRAGTGVRGAPPGTGEHAPSGVGAGAGVVVPVAVEPLGAGALVERLLGLPGEA